MNEHGAKPNEKGKSGKGTKGMQKRPTSGETKAKKVYAMLRGVKRGSADGKNDGVLLRDCSPIDAEASDEGLLSLVQAGTCRREILTGVFNNSPARKSRYIRCLLKFLPIPS